MTTKIATLVTRLSPDNWRAETGFSNDIVEAHSQLDNSADADSCADVINGWIKKQQPCVFGRTAAQRGLISHCVLNEEDLTRDDQYIKDKIQEGRLAWKRFAFEGHKSAFVLTFLSKTIRNAIPDAAMKDLSHALANLYLETDTEDDEIYLEEVFLEKPGKQRVTWAWDAGVNYFCSQGDKRWWHDHRFPGGMAFSVNSIGHMIKSAILAEGVKKLDQMLGGTAFEDVKGSTVNSSAIALKYAMATIDNAFEGVSGRATSLIDVSAEETASLPKCPIELPPSQMHKNHCEYHGFYHTDMTLPGEYFRLDVERPQHIGGHQLDFTYLFAPDDQDRSRLLDGRRIRVGDQDFTSENDVSKRGRMEPREVSLDEVEWLRGRGEKA